MVSERDLSRIAAFVDPAATAPCPSVAPSDHRQPPEDAER